MKTQKAYFAAGCFWGVQAEFNEIAGMFYSTVGYAGGDTENPTYQDVCTGTTGHAETVEIEYDISQATYQDLLNLFWQCHDPTQLNRQGPDVGTQYRSAIFYANAEQQTLAAEAKQQQITQGILVQTEISPLKHYYLAEEYHQNYIAKQQRQNRY